MTQTLREKIAEKLLYIHLDGATDYDAEADAILSVIAESVEPLNWHGWNSSANYPSCSALGSHGCWYLIDQGRARWEKPEFPLFFRTNCYEEFFRISEHGSLEEAQSAAMIHYSNICLKPFGLSAPEQEKGE